MNEIKSKVYTGKVLKIENAAENLFYIDILMPNFPIKAGQFISVLCGDYTLRRPFSVMNYENDTITILFKLKGKGTKYMSTLKINDKINFSGPFGNCFNTENKKSLLVAAGVGVAPMNFLKKELDNINIENKLISGFLNKNNIPKEINIDKCFTDDGSFGDKGSIINYLEEEIKTFNPQKIYACGPSIVLKKLSEYADKYNIPCEVAMEKEMACSIGVCRGCVIELKNGQIASVCKDGPVFSGSEIKW